MSRRSRAIGFLGLAALCAIASASLAARYRGGVEQSYGPTRTVVTVERELVAGKALDADDLRRQLGRREVPERFIPPDAIVSPGQMEGARPVASVPAGSYLLVSHLRAPAAAGRLPSRLSPIEVRVAAAGGLTRSRRPGAWAEVDVIAAREPGVGQEGRVVVLARAVPLLELRRSAAAGARQGGGWVATLGLDRSQALRVIEAENFSRELRLLPRPGGDR